MAKRKTSKSDFIRSLPKDLSPTEVIAKGKEAGLTISKALIYIARTGWKPKKKRASKGKASPAPTATATAAVAKPAASGKMSASDFIRAQPASMSARKVAEEAAKHGHSFRPQYVYAIRRKASKRTAPKAAGHAPAVASAAAAPQHKVSHSSAKQAMRSLMIEIGTAGFDALASEVLRELKGSGH